MGGIGACQPRKLILNLTYFSVASFLCLCFTMHGCLINSSDIILLSFPTMHATIMLSGHHCNLWKLVHAFLCCDI